MPAGAHKPLLRTCRNALFGASFGLFAPGSGTPGRGAVWCACTKAEARYLLCVMYGYFSPLRTTPDVWSTTVRSLLSPISPITPRLGARVPHGHAQVRDQLSIVSPRASRIRRPQTAQIFETSVPIKDHLQDGYLCGNPCFRSAFGLCIGSSAIPIHELARCSSQRTAAVQLPEH